MQNNLRSQYQDNTLFYCVVPVPFHGSKKNSKQIRFNRKTKRSFITSNDRVLDAQAHLISVLKFEKEQQKVGTIFCNVNMKITFLFPETKFFTKKGLRNKKIPDISNLYELVQDVLQKVEILEDDNLVESHDGSRRTPIKGEKYWLEIEITKAVINPV